MSKQTLFFFFFSTVLFLPGVLFLFLNLCFHFLSFLPAHPQFQGFLTLQQQQPLPRQQPPQHFAVPTWGAEAGLFIAPWGLLCLSQPSPPTPGNKQQLCSCPRFEVVYIKLFFLNQCFVWIFSKSVELYLLSCFLFVQNWSARSLL